MLHFSTLKLAAGQARLPLGGRGAVSVCGNLRVGAILAGRTVESAPLVERPANCTSCHALATGSVKFKCLNCHAEIAAAAEDPERPAPETGELRRGEERVQQLSRRAPGGSLRPDSLGSGSGGIRPRQDRLCPGGRAQEPGLPEMPHPEAHLRCRASQDARQEPQPDLPWPVAGLPELPCRHTPRAAWLRLSQMSRVHKVEAGVQVRPHAGEVPARRALTRR